MQCSDCQSKTHHFSAHKLWERGLWTPSMWDANFGKTRPREIQDNYHRGSTCVLQIFPYVTNDVCHQSKDRIVDRNPQVLRSSASNLDVPCDRGSVSSPPDEASRGVTFGGLSFPQREGRSSPRTPTRYGWRSVGIGDWSCQNTARQKRRKQRTPPMRFYNMSQLWLTRS